MIALPNTLSGLLELAVQDAQKCEALPELYRFDMGNWAFYAPKTPSVCSVCMAGAVMLQSLGFEATTERLDPARVGSDAVRRAMWAIDSMREGEFSAALAELSPASTLTSDQDKSLSDCEETITEARIDDSDDEGDPADRAPWSAYLKCAEMLREVGL